MNSVDHEVYIAEEVGHALSTTYIIVFNRSVVYFMGPSIVSKQTKKMQTVGLSGVDLIIRLFFT